MASYASIKVRPKTEQKPSVRTLAHNQRIAKNIDLLPMEHRLENYHMNKLSNLTKTFNDWKLENEERYQKINNRKLRSDGHRLESLVIVLSSEQVATQNPDDIWEKAKEFKVWFEEKYKTKVRTMDWHRDEGHIDENGIVMRNDHIHLEYDNVNEDGKMVRKLFSKGDLIKFQDKIAEIYEPLGFIRGENTAKKLATDTPKRGTPQKQWKKKKIKSALAKNKDVNSLNKELRAELAKALEQSELDNTEKRKQYAKLEATIKVLRDSVKRKELTIEELKNSEAKALKRIKNFPTIREHEEMMLENYNLLEKIEKKDEEIKKLNKNIDFKWKRIKEVKLENIALKSENSTLKAELATLPSQGAESELKTLKIDFEHEIEQKNEHIKKLEDGYKKISKSIGTNVDKIEVKDIDLIVKTVSVMATIIENASKYLSLAEDKLISLFRGEKPPKSHEVEKETKIADIVLPEPSSKNILSSLKFKR